MLGSIAAWISFGKSNNFAFLTSPKCLFVSGRITQVKITAISVITPAIIKGMEAPKPTVKAEIAGPKIKPKPKEAPIIPNPLALSFGLVVSEITAEATGIFPAVIPSKALAKKRIAALGAKAVMKKERAVPKSDIIRRGFLPYLSDSLPISGVEINWQIEKRENSKPLSKSDKPNLIEYE